MSFFNEIKVLDDSGSLITHDNPFSVQLPPKISTVNSTETVLLADEVYYGASEELNGYGIIYVNVYSNVASATDGLLVFQSSNGVNWDHCDEYTVPANIGKNFSINPHAAYYKVQYTNGSTIQTSFRLQCILKATGKSSSHRIQDSISSDDDAELVKSVITGETPLGNFKNANVTVDGYLSISDNSSGLAIAKGDVTGVSAYQKFGYAADFDTGDGIITAWDGAVDGAAWEQMLYQYSTTAAIDSVSSSSAADTEPVVVIGLDENYNEVTQEVNLSGQTRVALTTNLIRVYRAYNGNGSNFAGTVVVYENTALTTGIPTDKTKLRAIIQTSAQQTLMCVYTIPAGKTGYLTRGYASTAGSSRDSNYVIRFFKRDFGSIFRLQNINSISDTGNSNIVLDYFIPLRIEEKSDLEVRVQATAVGATGCAVAAGFDLILVDN